MLTTDKLNVLYKGLLGKKVDIPFSGNIYTYVAILIKWI